jgi:hypothetical protein
VHLSLGGSSGGSSETTSDKFDGENCITTKPYTKITKKDLLNGVWYSKKSIYNSRSYFLYNLYRKYDFKEDGTINYSSCSSSCKTIYRREWSYELVDGALIVDGESFANLFTLDRIKSNGGWALKKQGLNGRECKKTIHFVTWVPDPIIKLLK